MKNETLILIVIIVIILTGIYLIVWNKPEETNLNSFQTPSSNDPVLVGAGDIAACDNTHDEQTAQLLDSIPGTVFTAGDNAYPDGSIQNFTECYGPSWGRFKERTRPAPGNHDYNTKDAQGYFSFFGANAGDPTRGYYSYDIGSWHVIVLNSNCDKIGGCEAGSPQEQWLRADLADNRTTCTLAYMHHPRFSSGLHGSTKSVQPLWQALYEAGADVVLAGHDHTYERFTPQDPDGKQDQERGIRQFVVGTGGKDLYPFLNLTGNSEVKNNSTYGVLKLTLHESSYDWEFVPVAGGTFRDSGSATCH